MSIKNKIIKTAAVLAIPFVLAACATAEQSMMDSGKQQMDAAAIATLVAGKTIEWKNSKASGTASYNSNSTANVNWGKGDKPGMWRVDADANKLCTTWEHNKKDDKAVEKCASVYMVGDNAYQSFKADGTENSSFSVK